MAKAIPNQPAPPDLSDQAFLREVARLLWASAEYSLSLGGGDVSMSPQIAGIIRTRLEQIAAKLDQAAAVKFREFL